MPPKKANKKGKGKKGGNKPKKANKPQTAPTDSTTTTTTTTTQGGETNNGLVLVPTERECVVPVQDKDADKLVEKQLKSISASPHPFWETQPVPQIVIEQNAPEYNGPIDEIKTVEQIKQTPYSLLGGLTWVDMHIDDDAEMDQIYTLLAENYVEDDDNMFRFAYSRDFLRWALKPPGYRTDWHVGIKKGEQLLAFITAIPAHIYVFDKKVTSVEINFLCVHKSLREKRLAPVLIKEITRRVNLTDCWQAVYTGGRVLPRPVAVCRYFHRSLNPRKLIAVGFSHIAPRMTMARTIKLYKLDDEPHTPGVRPLEQKDVEETAALLAAYLSRFKLTPVFSIEEFAHWFLPRDGVVHSYVVQNPTTNKITDFFSFYALPSTIINHPQYNTLNAAYSFYNVAGGTEWKVLMKDALIIARKLGFDVFNALDLMENETFLKDLQFGVGDGKLHYYLYNWKCPPMTSAGLGLVLM